MGCNNKHIFEENSESEKLVGRLLNYVDDEIKDNSHKNIASNRCDEHNQYKENMINLNT